MTAYGIIDQNELLFFSKNISFNSKSWSSKSFSSINFSSNTFSSNTFSSNSFSSNIMALIPVLVLGLLALTPVCSKILARLRNLIIFEVIAVKLSAKKSSLQNCPIKPARRQFRKSDFLAEHFTPKTSKGTKLR